MSSVEAPGTKTIAVNVDPCGMRDLQGGGMCSSRPRSVAFVGAVGHVLLIAACPGAGETAPKNGDAPFHQTAGNKTPTSTAWFHQNATVARHQYMPTIVLE